jgi:hypothetical protein
MAEALLFYYVGDDEAYYKALEAEFKKLSRVPITFKKIFAAEESRIQSLFIPIYEDHPDCVFLDFSKLTQEYLHLGRLLSRSKFEKKILFVGLLDLLTQQDVSMESLVAGMHLSHYKSPEIFDVVFDITKLLAPEQIGEHGFATATFKESWKAGVFCKIGYVHADGIHFETDYNLNPGQQLELHHSWKEKKIIPSRQIVVNNVTQTNLFYHFKYAVDAEFRFIDELVKDETASEESMADREEDRKELIRRSKKLFSNWLEEHETDSQQKIAKVLIIDKDFHFYQNQKRVDKLPYMIRCLPYMNDLPRELVEICPQVIAVALEDDGQEKTRNNFEFLERLVSSINKDLQKEDRPFIVVFNTSIPSKGLQHQLGYPQLMAASNELSVDVLLRMAALFEKKLADAKEAGAKKKDKQVFIKKTNPASVADFDVVIDVLKISETDIIFQSSSPLPEGTNLRLRTPVPMVIHTQPLKTQGKVPEFIGYIHCLSESDKKELRRYVNSVFFRDHDVQKMGELNEFKKLNEAKLNERMAAQKKKEDEENKKKEEAEKQKKQEEEEKLAHAEDEKNKALENPEEVVPAEPKLKANG